MRFCIFPFTPKVFANSSPGLALKPWGKAADLFGRDSEGVATVLELATTNATPSGLRLLSTGTPFPRVAKAQPWAGVGEHLRC